MPYPTAPYFAVSPAKLHVAPELSKIAAQQLAEINRKRWEKWLADHAPVRWAEDPIYLSRINERING